AKFKPPPPSERAIIPYGMPLLVRPGNFLLDTGLSRRASAFICYAGRQTEDIDATFDQALPLPIPLVSRHIDQPAFSFQSSYTIEGRTLKIHREFVSRVPGQSCPADLQARIADDMNLIRVNMNSAL